MISFARRILGASVFCLGAVLFAQSHGDIAMVTGRVISDKGEPVSAASVYFELVDRPAVGHPTVVHTDERGIYEVSIKEAGHYAIHAFKPEAGYADVTFAFNLAPGQIMQKVNIKKGDNLNGVDIKLGPKSGTLHVRVVDHDTDQVLAVADYTVCQVQTFSIALIPVLLANSILLFLQQRSQFK